MNFLDITSAMKKWLQERIQSRQGGTWLLAFTYLILCTLLRIGLLLASAGSVSWGLATFSSLFIGFFFDAFMAWLLTLPYALLSSVCRGKWAHYLLIPLWCFGAFLVTFWKISEIIFWDEFGVRFNFIAVDYLVYTSEVVKNIRESYNLPLIFSGVGIVAIGFFFLWRKVGLTKLWLEGSAVDHPPHWRTPVFSLAPLLVIQTYAYFVGTHDLKVVSDAHSGFGERLVAGLRHMGDIQPAFANNYDTELAKNGEYSFLAAFWTNQLEWKRFYPTRPDAISALGKRLSRPEAPLVDPSSSITRQVKASEPTRRWNIIQITVESLSAEFLGCYGDPVYAPKNLTPNLDRIARESLWFKRCYASGTRTVRGMEALSLSIPPIPGQSVLRRKGCENLSTLGSVLNAQGYDTAFIYGGDGFFDNMNYFFSTNGYRIVDWPRQEAAGVKDTFHNAWGACDEDSLSWSLDEADKAYAAGKPFHHFIMSTSNHRPYTWPAGKIDPQLKGREGGVAYTDYAIGAFLKAAQDKPWFKDTIFVIVADHCASVAGKRELEIRKYEIPLFIWSPANIPARQVDTMMGQIDLVPTLLGLMNFNYLSNFVGDDVFKPGYRPRVFISNYQKVAVLQENGLLTVLKPVRQAVQYQADLKTGALTPLKQINQEAVDEALLYYQGTDELFHNDGLKNPIR
jgi:phosphoglycerol transferase MdoB-like AlkP superfamily enzyme